MFKLLVSDLDETLLGTNKHVSKKNREAIAEAREHGVKFVPASGRGYESLQSTLEELGLRDKPGEYAISFNGGAITENEGNRLLYFKPFEFETVERIFRRGLDYDVGFHIYLKDKVFVKRVNEAEREYIKGRLETDEYTADDLDYFKDKEIVKILFVNPDYSYLKRIEEEMEDILGECDVSYSAGRYLEFNPKGVNKGSGILRLIERLGVTPEEVVAVGDNMNDLPMLQVAGLGVGVQNSIAELKPLCDAVTEATNDEDAIAEVVERFILPSIEPS